MELSSADSQLLAGLLNENCSCSTLDKATLEDRLSEFDLSPLSNGNPMIERYYSETPSFIALDELEEMRRTIKSIRRALALPKIRNKFLGEANEGDSERKSEGGVFLSFDFHRTSEGPKLIEINTNAGGAYLQFKLLQSQISCCKEIDPFFPNHDYLNRLEERFFSIFLEEWKLAGRENLPKSIVILDENPEMQFLYPEFVMFRDLVRSHGISCEILSPEDISFKGGALFSGGNRIDLIYNRLTDFHLSHLRNEAIRLAWESGDVVLTPNPRDYSLFAMKSNLIHLSDPEFLRDAGLGSADLETLQKAVPKTRSVSSDQSEKLWQERKNLFFKPTEGYGSKAVYNGGKITKSKFNEILTGGYISQELVDPSERRTSISGVPIRLKMDIRAYVYRNEILLLASRLYQGQTTNMRTPGGGFSPVFVLSKDFGGEGSV